MRSFFSNLIFLGLLIQFGGTLRAQENAPPAQPAAPAVTYRITGAVHSGKTPLPGVTVSAANTLTGKKYTAATVSDGTFAFADLPRGRYVVKTDFMGFAEQTQEIVLNPESPSGKAEFELILASRQEEAAPRNATGTAATRGFQSLTMDSSEAALSGEETGAAAGAGQNPGANDLAALPLSGAGADAPT
ncbi:MAG: carboxypeptidase regulatory-like domain-containing protein, partial [Candidatus Acidiferrum sp.]